MPGSCTAGFGAGFGTGPNLGLELKVVLKLTEACVLGSDALQSEGREGIQLKLGGRDCFCVSTFMQNNVLQIFCGISI